MTTPNSETATVNTSDAAATVTAPAAADVPVKLGPDDAVLSDQPVTVGEEAIEAARAIIAQEIADVRAHRWLRVQRTMIQAALGAAAVGGFHAYVSGVHNWRDLAYIAGEAAVTSVVAYVHNRVKPGN